MIEWRGGYSGKWCDSTSGMVSSTTTHGLRRRRRSRNAGVPHPHHPLNLLTNLNHTTTRMLVMRGLAGAFTRVHSHHRVVSMLSTTRRPSPLASPSSPRLSTFCTNAIQQQQSFSTTTGGNGAGGYDLL